MTTKQIIPVVEFGEIQQRIRSFLDPWQYNPHKGFLSTTRGGKSFLIRHGLLPLYKPSRVVLIDIKPGGARTWDGWGNKVTSLQPGFARGPNGSPHYHVMMQQGDKAIAQITDIFELIKAEGECVLIIDDSRKVTQSKPGWNQSGNVDDLLTNGGEVGVSVLIAANSPTWITSTIRDQCGSYFIGQMANRSAQASFANYAGIPNEYRHVLDTLKLHQFLYIDRFNGPPAIAVTNFNPEMESIQWT